MFAGLIMLASQTGERKLVKEWAKRSAGTVTVKPDIFLDGKGKNIDAPELWWDAAARQVTLFVTGKKNDLVERWELAEFSWQQHASLKRETRPNGLAIDEDKRWLLIGDSEEKLVAVFSLPELKLIKDIGKNVLGSGETNLDILTRSDGQKIVVVSEEERVVGFDLETGVHVWSIDPAVESVEEVLADSYHKVVYVAEENGGESKRYSGGAVLAFREDGTPFLRNGSHVFGQGRFSGDEEGMALYRCVADNQDTGRGFIIVANQADGRENRFEFFDRVNWQHLASVRLEGVTGTDGIDVVDQPVPGYPEGIFSAINDDTDVALVSMEKIFNATGLACS